MASLFRRAISLSSPTSEFLQSRYASSAASQPSSPHFQKKSEKNRKSADSAPNSCIHVPCPTRKLEWSSSPSSIRTDSINISKAVDSAVQRLQQESEEDNLIEEGDLSLEISDMSPGIINFEINVPGEYIDAYMLEGCIERLCASIEREDGCQLEYDEIKNSYSYDGTWESWKNYLQCSNDDLESDYLHFMRDRLERHVECILAKRGINKSMNPLNTAYHYVKNKRRRRAEQLAWMQNVKDFVLN